MGTNEFDCAALDRVIRIKRREKMESLDEDETPLMKLQRRLKYRDLVNKTNDGYLTDDAVR